MSVATNSCYENPVSIIISKFYYAIFILNCILNKDMKYIVVRLISLMYFFLRQKQLLMWKQAFTHACLSCETHCPFNSVDGNPHHIIRNKGKHFHNFTGAADTFVDEF